MSATALSASSAVLPIRVFVADVWDEVPLDPPPTATIAEVKAQALKRARVDGDPSQYLVKYRGAALDDESRSLASWGVVPNAALIVLQRRRQPVR